MRRSALLIGLFGAVIITLTVLFGWASRHFGVRAGTRLALPTQVLSVIIPIISLLGAFLVFKASKAAGVLMILGALGAFVFYSFEALGVLSWVPLVIAGILAIASPPRDRPQPMSPA